MGKLINCFFFSPPPPKFSEGVAGDPSRDPTKTFTYDFSYDSGGSGFATQEKVELAVL